MKTNFKRLALWGAAGYVVLLVLLLVVERSDPSASITTVSDAFWYSIVTLSTVGYGDLYPVTVVGRIIGFCFVLMSLGVLSFIVGAAVSFLTGQMFTALQLRTARNKQWFVFDEVNSSSLALAKDLIGHYPDSVMLFPLAQSDAVTIDGSLCYYPGTIAQAVEDKTDACSLFFMGAESENANYKSALAALPLGFPVYCCTAQVPVACPEGLTLFNRFDCCAQEYWRTLALDKNESTVLLVGDGDYARQLLERGLLVNVFGSDHRVSYHVFGNWNEFRRNHPQLAATLSIDDENPAMDCLFFHDAPWNEDGTLLRNADRIILCCDEDEADLDILRQLRQYFPTQGKIHLRAIGDIPGETVFGTNEKIYTSDLIMRGELAQTARMMHQIYVDGSNGQAAPWEDLSEFLQQSNIAAADHLLTKIRILLEDDGITSVNRETCAAAYKRYCQVRAEKCNELRYMEHLRWMRFHSLYNWGYSPVRDNAVRLHPMMRPFEELSLTEQAKDDYAWELLGKIADRM